MIDAQGQVVGHIPPPSDSYFIRGLAISDNFLYRSMLRQNDYPDFNPKTVRSTLAGTGEVVLSTEFTNIFSVSPDDAYVAFVDASSNVVVLNASGGVLSRVPASEGAKAIENISVDSLGVYRGERRGSGDQATLDVIRTSIDGTEATKLYSATVSESKSLWLGEDISGPIVSLTVGGGYADKAQIIVLGNSGRVAARASVPAPEPKGEWVVVGAPGVVP